MKTKMIKGENNRYSSLYILETQEIERKRISMELHDTTVQNITTLIHKTELINRLMDKDMVRAKLELQTMTKLLHSSITELRGIIYDLRPMAIDDLGLVFSMERFVKQVSLEDGAPKIFLNIEGKENKKIVSVVNLTLFRIVQEAYNNIRKHAQAKQVDINLCYREDQMELSIADDGVGFDFNEADKKNKHFGLSIMQERVHLLSGEIEIKTKKTEGTRVIVRVPMVEEEQDENAN